MPFKKGRTAILEEDVQRRGGELPATAEQAERAEPQAPLVMAPQRTVLGAAAQVKGDIASEEPIVIEGRVQGNIVCSKQVSVTGVVVGNITCQSFSLNSGKVKGDLVCSGSARVAESGEIEGAVTAQELALGGTLKGNARIEALTHLFSAKAYMQGDLTAGRLGVAEGARINGKVEIVQPEGARPEIRLAERAAQEPGEEPAVQEAAAGAAK